MRLRIDEAADALYIRFDEAPIVESEEVGDGVILDFDASGRVVGFEVLNVSERTMKPKAAAELAPVGMTEACGDGR